MKNFKNKIKSNLFLYSIGLLVVNRKNEKLISDFLSMQQNPNLIAYEEYKGMQTPESTVCEIVAGGKNDGFFATVRWALDGLYFCDVYGFEPIIKFHQNSIYADEDMPKGMNTFEYYFERTSGYSKDLSKCRMVKYDARNILLAEKMNNPAERYAVSDEYIKKMAYIMHKYLHFNKSTSDYLNANLEKLSVDDSYLGVHIRGTDFKIPYKGHPKYIDVDDYYEYIDDVLENKKFSKIFLATDDEDILDKMLKRYGKERLCYLKDINRVKGTVGAHLVENNERYHNYQLGLEVLSDMYLLSECGGIISSLAQVGTMARIYKASQGKDYIYDKIINKGVNKKGRKFSR